MSKQNIPDKLLLSPEEAIKLERTKREDLGYCICGKHGKLRRIDEIAFGVFCNECVKSLKVLRNE